MQTVDMSEYIDANEKPYWHYQEQARLALAQQIVDEINTSYIPLHPRLQVLVDKYNEIGK